MKVVVIGGAGVFGARLARLLVRDGREVVIAGRNTPAELANEIGVAALQVDRTGDLTQLWALRPDVVIDAAGPFHAYGDDPYRLAKAAIENRVHYLDLADDADFCAGISILDEGAQKAGIVVLSGASSVPALSSAIAADLARGVDAIDTIRTAILPGNKAPRGKSVVDSILHQTGRMIDVRVDGHKDAIRSWSHPRLFDLGAGLRRHGYAIRVPDQGLFPGFFQARTVEFYAGLELGLMSFGLSAWSRLRSWLRLGNPAWLRAMVHRVASLLDPFGSDVGGMQVTVIGQYDGEWREKQWQVIVRNGEGPFIPGVAARAILRDLASQPSGAGPALARFSRDAAQDAMADLSVTFAQSDRSLTALFPQVLGAAFSKLAAPVRDSHKTFAQRRWTGRGQVKRGSGWYPRLIAAMFGFPQATDDIPVTVLKTPLKNGEIWQRTFGKKRFESFLAPGPTGMSERFGPFTFDLGLHVSAGALHFPVKAGRIGPIPIPSWMLPRSVAREYDDKGNFCFDVALFAPFSGQMIVHYQGTLAREAGTDKAVKET